jgi:hypothetical protein
MGIALVDLLADLEDDITDESKDLGGVLLKCLRFARRAGAPQLREWALRELKGYGREDQLPPYRVLSAPVLYNSMTPRGTYTGIYLPLDNPDLQPIRPHLDRPVELRFPIEEIEASVAGADSAEVKFGPDNVARLVSFLTGFMPAYTRVTEVYWSVPLSSLRAINGQVRTALTEFVDELQSEVDATGAQPTPGRTRAVLAETMPWTQIIAQTVTVNQNTGDVMTESSKSTIKGNKTKVSKNSGTVVSAAAHVKVETRVGVDPAVVKEFADLVRQLAPTLGLSRDDQSELESAVSETEAAANAPGAQKSLMQRGVQRAVAAIKRAGPGLAQKAVLGAADDLLVHLAEDGMHQIGM